MSHFEQRGDETVVHSGADARRRLTELGIDVGALESALDAGDVAARQADDFSPVTAAGTMRWFETVRTLRQRLAESGWTCSDVRNSPRAIDPTGREGLLAVRGNAATGRIDGDPKTARPRGNASSRSVRVNGQLMMDVVVAALADMAGERALGVRTWFLLYYRSEADELRAEVSLPVAISDQGVVEDWDERIILEPRTFGAPLSLPRDAGGGDDVEFEIVSR